MRRSKSLPPDYASTMRSEQEPPSSPMRYQYESPTSPTTSLFNLPRQQSAPQTARGTLYSSFGRRFCSNPQANLMGSHKLRADESPRVAALRHSADKRLPAAPMKALMRDLFPGRISGGGHVPDDEVFFAVEKPTPPAQKPSRRAVLIKTAPAAKSLAATIPLTKESAPPDAQGAEGEPSRKWIDPWKAGFGQKSAPLTARDLSKRDQLELEIKELKRNQWGAGVASGESTVRTNKQQVWLTNTPAATRRGNKERGITATRRQQAAAAKRAQQQEEQAEERLQKAQFRAARRADAETGQRRRLWKLITPVASVTCQLVNMLQAHHAEKRRRVLLVQKVRVIQRAFRLFNLGKRVRLRKLVGRAMRTYIFRYRMKSYMRWRKDGPPLILQFLADVRVKQDALEVIQSDTLGSHVKRYFQQCKRMGRWIDSYAAKWRNRKRTLAVQWSANEQIGLEKIKQQRLKKRAGAEKSLKFGNNKEMRGMANSKKEEMIAAMVPFKFDPLSIVSNEARATVLDVLAKLCRQAHTVAMREWLKEVGAFDNEFWLLAKMEYLKAMTKSELPEGGAMPWNVRRFGKERMRDQLALRPKQPQYPHKLVPQLASATFELAQSVTQNPLDSEEATVAMVTNKLTQLLVVKW